MCGQTIRKQGRMKKVWNAYSGYRARRVSTFQNTSMTPWRPSNLPTSTGPGRYLEAERKSPFRPQNAESDFLVPLFQALGTGVFVTTAAGWFAWRYTGFTWEGAVSLGIISAGGFWLITVMANRKLLWQIESIINSDLDNDGDIGQPEPVRPTPVGLEIIQRSEGNNNFKRMFRFELPSGVTEEVFREFVRGVINERRGLAESGWIGSGKPFSRQSWGSLMETLRAAGIVRWKDDDNHARGHELIPSGRLALRKYIQPDHSPTGSNNYSFVPDVG